MNRINGFIDISQMLEEIGVDTTSFESILGSSFIDKIGDNEYRYHFSFNYNGETYFFKVNNYDYKNGYNEYVMYNELIVEELALDYGIPCTYYDLAHLNSSQGVLSKNYKLENVNYIYGCDLLDNYEKGTGRFVSNTLASINHALEYRYLNNSNKKEIVSNLMKKIVDIYLFDIITCQCDRHSHNFQLMESDDNIDIAPLYDNELILKRRLDLATVALKIKSGQESLWKSIKHFQNVSRKEYINKLENKIWIIGSKNLNLVFERVENKIGCALPDRYKYYLSNDYEAHQDMLEKTLGMNNKLKKYSR